MISQGDIINMKENKSNTGNIFLGSSNGELSEEAGDSLVTPKASHALGGIAHRKSLYGGNSCIWQKSQEPPMRCSSGRAKADGTESTTGTVGDMKDSAKVRNDEGNIECDLCGVDQLSASLFECDIPNADGSESTTGSISVNYNGAKVREDVGNVERDLCGGDEQSTSLFGCNVPKGDIHNMKKGQSNSNGISLGGSFGEPSEEAGDSCVTPAASHAVERIARRKSLYGGNSCIWQKSQEPPMRCSSGRAKADGAENTTGAVGDMKDGVKIDEVDESITGDLCVEDQQSSPLFSGDACGGKNPDSMLKAGFLPSGEQICQMPDPVPEMKERMREFAYKLGLQGDDLNESNDADSESEEDVLNMYMDKASAEDLCVDGLDAMDDGGDEPALEGKLVDLINTSMYTANPEWISDGSWILNHDLKEHLKDGKLMIDNKSVRYSWQYYYVAREKSVVEWMYENVLPFCIDDKDQKVVSKFKDLKIPRMKKCRCDLSDCEIRKFSMCLLQISLIKSKENIFTRLFYELLVRIYNSETSLKNKAMIRYTLCVYRFFDYAYVEKIVHQYPSYSIYPGVDLWGINPQGSSVGSLFKSSFRVLKGVFLGRHVPDEVKLANISDFIGDMIGVFGGSYSFLGDVVKGALSFFLPLVAGISDEWTDASKLAAGDISLVDFCKHFWAAVCDPNHSRGYKVVRWMCMLCMIMVVCIVIVVIGKATYVGVVKLCQWISCTDKKVDVDEILEDNDYACTEGPYEVISVVMTMLFDLMGVSTGFRKTLGDLVVKFAPMNVGVNQLLMSLIPWLPYAIQTWITGGASEVQADVESWIMESSATTAMMSTPGIYSNVDFQKRVIELIKRGNVLQSKVRELGPRAKGKMPVNFKSTMDTLIKALSSMVAISGVNKVRPEPVVRHMYGVPGCGKSMFLSNINSILRGIPNHAGVITYDPQVYRYEPTSHFWQGFQQDKYDICTIDECWDASINLSNPNYMRTLLNIVSSNPYMPDMPDINANSTSGTKGTTFNCPVVITAYNDPIPSWWGVTYHDALLRRFGYVTEVIPPRVMDDGTGRVGWDGLYAYYMIDASPGIKNGGTGYYRVSADVVAECEPTLLERAPGLYEVEHFVCDGEKAHDFDVVQHLNLFFRYRVSMWKPGDSDLSIENWATVDMKLDQWVQVVMQECRLKAINALSRVEDTATPIDLDAIELYNGLLDMMKPEIQSQYKSVDELLKVRQSQLGDIRTRRELLKSKYEHNYIERADEDVIVHFDVPQFDQMMFRGDRAVEVRGVLTPVARRFPELLSNDIIDVIMNYCPREITLEEIPAEEAVSQSLRMIKNSDVRSRAPPPIPALALPQPEGDDMVWSWGDGEMLFKAYRAQDELQPWKVTVSKNNVLRKVFIRLQNMWCIAIKFYYIDNCLQRVLCYYVLNGDTACAFTLIGNMVTICEAQCIGNVVNFSHARFMCEDAIGNVVQIEGGFKINFYANAQAEDPSELMKRAARFIGVNAVINQFEGSEPTWVRDDLKDKGPVRYRMSEYINTVYNHGHEGVLSKYQGADDVDRVTFSLEQILQNLPLLRVLIENQDFLNALRTVGDGEAELLGRLEASATKLEPFMFYIQCVEFFELVNAQYHIIPNFMFRPLFAIYVLGFKSVYVDVQHNVAYLKGNYNIKANFVNDVVLSASHNPIELLAERCWPGVRANRMHPTGEELTDPIVTQIRWISKNLGDMYMPNWAYQQLPDMSLERAMEIGDEVNLHVNAEREGYVCSNCGEFWIKNFDEIELRGRRCTATGTYHNYVKVPPNCMMLLYAMRREYNPVAHMACALAMLLLPNKERLDHFSFDMLSLIDWKLAEDVGFLEAYHTVPETMAYDCEIIRRMLKFSSAADFKELLHEFLHERNNIRIFAFMKGIALIGLGCAVVYGTKKIVGRYKPTAEDLGEDVEPPVVPTLQSKKPKHTTTIRSKPKIVGLTQAQLAKQQGRVMMQETLWVNGNISLNGCLIYRNYFLTYSHELLKLAQKGSINTFYYYNHRSGVEVSQDFDANDIIIDVNDDLALVRLQSDDTLFKTCDNRASLIHDSEVGALGTQMLMCVQGVCDIRGATYRVNCVRDLNPATYIYNTVNDNDNYFPRSLTLEHTLNYDVETQPGDCGTLIFGCSGRFSGRIIGLHVALYSGRSMGCCATIPTYEKIMEMVKTFSVDTSTQKLAETQGFVRLYEKMKDCTGPNLVRLSRVSEDKIVDLPTKTAYRKTTYEVPEDIRREPAILTARDPRSEGRDPAELAMRELIDIEQPVVDDRLLAKCTIDCIRQVKRTVVCSIKRELTFEEAVCGVPGKLNSINFSSGAGYPYCYDKHSEKGKKDYVRINDGVLEYDQEFYDSCMDLKRRLEAGDRSVFEDYPFRWLAYEKDELRPMKKIKQCKTRMIYCNSLVWFIVIRMKYGGLIQAFNSNGGHSIYGTGLNNCSYDMHKFYEQLSRFGDGNGRLPVICGDYSGFDKHYVAKFQQAAYKVMQEYGRCNIPDWNDMAWALIVEHEMCPLVMCGDTLFELVNSHFSGCAFTTPENCTVNNLYFRYVFSLCDCEDFDDHVEMVAVGDDHLLSVDPIIRNKFNMMTVYEKMKMIGQVYTTAEKEVPTVPFVDFSECSFLGCYPRLIDGKYAGALRLVTLYGDLSYFTQNVEVAAFFDQMLDMASVWDEPTYRKYYDFVCTHVNDYTSVPNYSYRERQLIQCGRTVDSGESWYAVAQGGNGDHSTPDSESIDPALQELKNCNAISEEYLQNETNEVNKKQVTTLAEAKTTPSQNVNKSEERIVPNIDPYVLLDIQKSYREVKQVTISKDTVVGSIIQTWELPKDLISTGVTAQTSAFRYASYFRGDITIKISVNCAPTAQGALVLYFLPMRTRTYVCSNLHVLSGAHLILNLGETPVGEMTIPFNYYYPFFPLRVMPKVPLGTLVLEVLSVVKQPGETPITATVYAKYDKCEFYAPRVHADPQGPRDEEEAQTSLLLGLIPGDNKVSRITRHAIGIASEFLPLDRPMYVGGSGYPTHKADQQLNVVNGALSGYTVGYNGGSLYDRSKYVFNDTDNNLESILNREQITHRVSLSSSRTGIVGCIPVGYVITSTSSNVGFQEAILSHFVRYRCTFHYRIYAFRNKYQNFTLKLALKYDNNADAISSTSDMNDYYNVVLPFKDDKWMYDVRVEYFSNTETINVVDGGIGSLTMSVVSPVNSLSTVVSDEVDVLVTRSLENVHVGGISQIHALPTEIISNYTNSDYNASGAVTQGPEDIKMVPSGVERLSKPHADEINKGDVIPCSITRLCDLYRDFQDINLTKTQANALGKVTYSSGKYSMNQMWSEYAISVGVNDFLLVRSLFRMYSGGINIALVNPFEKEYRVGYDGMVINSKYCGSNYQMVNGLYNSVSSFGVNRGGTYIYGNNIFCNPVRTQRITDYTTTQIFNCPYDNIYTALPVEMSLGTLSAFVKSTSTFTYVEACIGAGDDFTCGVWCPPMGFYIPAISKLTSSTTYINGIGQRDIVRDGEF